MNVQAWIELAEQEERNGGNTLPFRLYHLRESLQRQQLPKQRERLQALITAVEQRLQSR